MPDARRVHVAVGVDIGGTFTDVVAAFPDGRIVAVKVQSDHAEPARPVVDGILLLLGGLDHGVDVETVAHGTTMASNTLLQQSGDVTALVTTEGFRDVLELRRGGRPTLYDLDWCPSPPLVTRENRIEVRERIDATGAMVHPIGQPDLDEVVERVAGSGARSVAICLVNAHANPANEKAVADALRSRLPDAHVTCSHEVLPEPGEFERTSTTVVNAYLAPVMGDYLRSLSQSLAREGIHARLQVAKSDGSLGSASSAAERPVELVESGPAAGVIAASQLAAALDRPNAIAFDMGGTTAKACLVERGEAAMTAELEVAGDTNQASRLLGGRGYPVRTRATDLAEVGAGGGSIAWVDASGALRVGPRSAGASPGPAAYGTGATDPTVTDAQLVLGYLGTRLAGGGRRLDHDAAAEAIDSLARQLGVGRTETAAAVYLIATETMRRAVRAVTIERGRDPRDFSLVAFGGGGPVHACQLAELLDITEIVFPPLPGVFSSLGLLLARAATSRSRAVGRPLQELGRAGACELVDALAAEAGAGLGAGNEPIERRSWLGLRYVGQTTAVALEADLAPTTGDWGDAVERSFHEEHSRRYGFSLPEGRVEVATVQVTCSAPAAAVDALAPTARHLPLRPEASADDAPPTSRRSWFGTEHGWVEAPVLDRRTLHRAGATVEGPCFFDEADTTIVVFPGWRAQVDGSQVVARRG